MPDKELLNHIRSRATELLQQLAQGQDISPAALYRFEGLAEAAELLGYCDRQQLEELVSELAEQILDSDQFEHFRENRHILLPVRMQKAPVFPSTS